MLGRYFLPEECRGTGAKVALISYGVWRRLFAGSADAMGKIIHLDNDPFLIIGVLPPTAVYPADVDVWFPFDETLSHEGYWLDGVGRLKPGVSVAQAAADLMRVHKNAIPIRAANRLSEPRLTPLREHYLGDYRNVTETLLAAVGFVLLIACVNVAGLILARGMARGREAAIRAALGAGRGRLIQQLLAETLLVAGAGGAIGVALGWAALDGMLPLMPDVVPSWVTFHADARFAWFAVALTAASAVFAGLWPALEFSRTDLRGALGEAAPRTSLSAARRRGLNALVIGEVALALVLLSAGGLVLKAFRKVVSVDPGFRARSALTFAVNPPYTGDEQRRRYYRGWFEALRAAPGVEAVGGSNMPPLGDNSPERVALNFRAEGEAERPTEQQPVAVQRVVMPGYFRAMGISLKAGREFDERDLRPSETPPVMINETLARLLFPRGTDAVGRRVAARTVNGWMQVVGVAPDVRYEGLDRETEPSYYFCQNYPATGQSTLHMYFVVRGSIDPQSLTTLARQVARQLDPGLAIYDVRTMEQWLDRSLGMRRAYTWLFGVFAAVALLLALAGIYGVVSYTVTQRTREIGIRVALGARPRQVVAEVVRGTMALAGIGIAVGLCGAWFATRTMTKVLAEVNAHDPWALGVVVLALGMAVLAATLWPAVRAASVDPVRALRE
jgi:predicted permease